MSRLRLTFAVTGLALVAALAGGCGSGSKTYANNDRPAAPIVITAAITQSGVSVSPTSFGAGLVQLIVTNLTNRSAQLTLSSSDGSSFAQQSGPINPQGTARLQADLVQGGYALRVSSAGVHAAKLSVGPTRAPSNNQLLQP